MGIDLFNKKILPLKDKLFRLAWMILRDQREAEDVVQDVMLKVWSKKDKWELIGNIEAYCYRSTRNLALDRQAMSTFRRTDSIDEKEDATADYYTPYLQLIHQEKLHLIYKCVNELPMMQKTVFQLREIEEMSYKQIAHTLDMTVESVKINLFRARKKIKEMISNIN